MGKLTLKNGKFYRDGKVVKPEFGNKEQIALMEEWRKELEKGILVTTDVYLKMIHYLSISWECLCGRVNETSYHEQFEDGYPNEDDIKSSIGDYVCCESCDKEYELHVTNGRETNTIKGYLLGDKEYRLKPKVDGDDK